VPATVLLEEDIGMVELTCWGLLYFLVSNEIKLPAIWGCNYALNVSYLFVFCCVALFGVTRLFWCAGAVSSFMAE